MTKEAIEQGSRSDLLRVIHFCISRVAEYSEGKISKKIHRVLDQLVEGVEVAIERLEELRNEMGHYLDLHRGRNTISLEAFFAAQGLYGAITLVEALGKGETDKTRLMRMLDYCQSGVVYCMGALLPSPHPENDYRDDEDAGEKSVLRPSGMRLERAQIEARKAEWKIQDDFIKELLSQK